MTGRSRLPTRREVGIVVACVVVGVVLRVAFPGADALHPRWHGWMTDEGRWTELAREWALFRAPDLDSSFSRVHLLIAPLFQAVVALVFELFGVGLEQARLLPRVAGVGLLLLAVVGLRRALHPLAWVAMAALVALHPELVYFSRVAVPEMPALLAGFVAFLLVVRPDASRAGDGVAGLLTAAALGFKATAAPYVPALALAFWVVGRPRDGRSPWHRLTVWGLGLVAPGLIVVAPVVASGMGLPGASQALGSILGVVELKGAYQAVTTFLIGENVDDVNLLLAVLCPIVVGVALRSPPDSPARRIHRGALAWVGAWLFPIVLLDYFPARYVVHLHLALILAVCGGVALLLEPGGRSLAQGWQAWSRSRRIAAGALAALPLAVVIVPPALNVVDLFGPRLDRVRLMIPLLLAVATGAGVAGARHPGGRLFGPALLIFPLAATVLWRGIMGPAVERYWVIDASAALLPWVPALLLGGAAAWALGRLYRGAEPRLGLAAASLGYVAALIVLWGGIRHVPTITRPSYQLAGVSEALTQRYPADQVLGVAKLSGALIETPFRYREVLTVDSLPDVVLTAITSPDAGPRSVRSAGFHTVQEFEIAVFLFRGMPRPEDQDLFADRLPVELLERGAAPPPSDRPEPGSPPDPAVEPGRANGGQEGP